MSTGLGKSPKPQPPNTADASDAVPLDAGAGAINTNPPQEPGMANKMNIYQRINAVMKELPYIQKDDTVGKEGSSWAYQAVTHDLVTAMVRPLFIKFGIVLEVRQVSGTTTPTGTETKNGTPIIRFEGSYEVDFVNMDDPEDRICHTVVAHANDEGDKSPGKSLSYAIKTVLLKGLQIETGESDESRIPENGVGGEKKTIEEPTSKSSKTAAKTRETEWKDPAANDADVRHLSDRKPTSQTATQPSGSEPKAPATKPSPAAAGIEFCSEATAKMINSWKKIKNDSTLVKQSLENHDITKLSEMPRDSALALLKALKALPDPAE